MTKIQEAALANLKRACAGRPIQMFSKKSGELLDTYCKVNPLDVIEVGKLIPDQDPDDPIAILIRSVQGLSRHNEAHPLTHVVAHLCDLADKAVAASAPPVSAQSPAPSIPEAPNVPPASSISEGPNEQPVR